jgi:hypothetical protein
MEELQKEEMEELQKKEEELKEQIDMKVSTKFQINPSTNGWEKCTQSDMGTSDGRSL